MKTKLKTSLAAITVFAMLCCAFVSVSAKSYIKNVVNEDFESQSSCGFLIPGDANADKEIDAQDMTMLAKVLLNADTADYIAVYSADANAKYADVNGDAKVNLKDLLRQKKSVIKYESTDFISSGTGVDGSNCMVIDGNSPFAGEFVSAIGTGASYNISFSYKAEDTLFVKINGLGTQKVFENAASSDWKSVDFNFTSPLNVTSGLPVELQIIGNGQIDNFKVTRINMDNELTESW